jgi:hypothetical protein
MSKTDEEDGQVKKYADILCPGAVTYVFGI